MLLKKAGSIGVGIINKISDIDGTDKISNACVTANDDVNNIGDTINIKKIMEDSIESFLIKIFYMMEV